MDGEVEGETIAKYRVFERLPQKQVSKPFVGCKLPRRRFHPQGSHKTC